MYGTSKARDIVLKKAMDNVLREYQNSNFLLQQKSRILFGLCCVGILVMTIFSIVNIIEGRTEAGFLVPLVGGVIYLAIALIFLKKGYYQFTAHSFLVMMMAAAWSSIFF